MKLFLFSLRSWLYYVILLYQVMEIKCCTIVDPLTTSATGARVVTSQIDQKNNFCAGIWFMHQALSEKCSQQSSKENFHIFTISNMDNVNQIFMVFSMKTNSTIQVFNPTLVINSGINLYNWEFDLVNTEIESQWHYIHICFNVHSSPILLHVFFDQIETALMQSGTIPMINTYNKQQIQIGGQINIVNPFFKEGNLNLAQFPGKIGNIQIFNTDASFLVTLTNYLSFLSSNPLCSQTNPCNGQITQYLIENVEEFTGKKLLEFQKNYVNGKYTIEGWGKLNILDQELTQNVVQLMRVSLCSSYQDNQNLGDRIFLFRYLLNRQPELNGLYIATFNMISPSVLEYQTSSDDEWIDFNTFYEDAFYEWHYFQFQYGISDIDFNTQILIFFKKEYKNIYHKFQSRIQGSESSLYFSIGGDKLMLDNLLKGQVANLKFTYCNTLNIPFKKTCHYSCQDCDGPTENDCIICPDQSISKRVILKKTINGGQCSCDLGFQNVIGQQNCVKIADQFTYMTIIEIPNEDLTCSYSYFLVKGQYKQFCLQCPGKITNNGFYCANCLTKPKTWYLNPICTYDYVQYDLNINSVYEERQRLEINQEYYIINEQQESLELCLGCKGITQNVTNYYLTTILKFVQIECKQCYQFNGKQCIKVMDNCNYCDSSNQCIECFDGFVYDLTSKKCLQCPRICPKCIYTNEKFECLSCPERYALVQGDCIQCGMYCQLCDQMTALSVTFLKCYKCIDVNKYYLSMDHVSCYKNEISNCLIAVQREKGDINVLQQSSIDIFIPYPTSLKLQVFCALCQPGYTNYINSTQCKDLKSTFIESIIFNSDNLHNITALKSVNPKDKSLVMYDQNCQLSNCLWCLASQYKSFHFCIECKVGYYAHSLSGHCIRCPATLNCRTCLHQYTKAKDSWKWAIRGYYNYALDTPENYHAYLGFVQPLDITKYEIICSSCPTGYDLYDEKCIKSCPKECKTCKIINLTNICIECHPSVEGQNQITINNTCIQCPYRCAFCRPQIQSDLKSLNPYFNPDYKNLTYFSNICLKQYQNLNYYYDTNLGLYVECTIIPCSKEVIFTLNVYCDSVQYDTLLQNYINDQDNYNKFKIKNIKIAELFSADQDSHFKILETLDLYTELSNNAVKIVLFQLTLIYNNKKCTVPNNGLLISKLRNNVYTLRYMQLQMYGDLNFDFEIINSLSIFGFNQIKFQNIKFQSSTSSQLLTIGFSEQINIEFNQLEFSGINSRKIEIIIQNPKKLIFSNLKLTQLNLQNQGSLFNFIYNITQIIEIEMTFQQLIITESNFKNTQLFDLPSNIQKQLIAISQVTIGPNVFFNDSKLFNSYIQNSQYIIQVTINQISIINSLIQNSQLFDLQGFQSIILNDIQITENQIEKSILFLFSIFSIEKCEVTSNQFIASRIFTNEGLTFTNNKHQLYQIVNLKLQSNTYTTDKTFLCIIQLFMTQNIIINDLQLLNNRLILDKWNQDVQITAQQSNFYIISNNIIIQNVLIIRNAGYPEFTLLNSNTLNINHLEAKINPENYMQILHNSIDCVKQVLKQKYLSTVFFILNYQQIEINEIKLHMLIILNKPIILIQSWESIILKQQESITITNSQFINITLMQTQVSVSQSIIQIVSDQNQQILMEDLIFENNHQISYVNDISYKSSATTYINSPNSQVQLINLQFNQNLVTNSLNSVIIIKADTLLIQNCYFNSNNQYKFELIQKYFIWGFDESMIIYLEDFSLTYQIQSNGGSGQFSINQLIIKDSIIYQSQAQKGGGFHLETSGEGYIQIYNTTFSQCTTTMFANYITQGGSLYIDSSQSKLQLIIINTKFINTFSRTEGGAIYISPSLSQTTISLVNIEVTESHSLLSSFLKIAKGSSTNQIITIDQIIIKNSQKGYLSFLGKILNITQSELTNQFNNYIFAVDQGYFSLNHIYIQSFGYGIFYSKNIINAKITNGKIFNIQLTVQQLFNIQLNYLIQSQITFDSLVINQISIYKEEQIYQTCQYYNIQKLQSECQSFQEKKLSFLYQKSNSSYENKIGNCHLNLISQQINSAQSIININQLQQQQLVYFNQLEFNQINCTNCLGLIKITNIIQYIDKKLQLSFKNINMSENACGQISCILILQDNVEVSLQKIKSQNRLLEQLSNNDMQITTQSIYSVNYSTIIENSAFIKNSANKFGVLLIDQIQTLINKCEFLQNQANLLGGALTFFGNNSEKLGLFNSIISQNKAEIGGGVYIEKYMIEKPTYLNNIYFDNKAQHFGADSVEFPNQLALSFDQGQKLLEKKQLVKTVSETTELITIQPYKILGETLKVNYLMLPSGQKINSYQYLDELNGYYIPYNLSLRILPLNQQGDRIKNLEQSICNIKGRQLDIQTKLPLNSFNQNYTNPTTITYNDSSQDYNLDELIVKFDPNLNNRSVLQLAISCDSVQIPIFQTTPPYQLMGYHQNYTLLVNIQTFQCQRGEQKNNQEGTCIQCDASSDYYNVEKGGICQIKDIQKMEAVKPAQIKLRPGYWRAYLSSEKIELCLNLLINCEGGWNPGDKSCYIGHIGALCEQCDIYNIRGQGAYSASNMYKCGSCNYVGDNTIKIALISVWTIISIFMSVRGSVDSIETLIKSLRLKKLGIISYTPKSGYDAVLIKVITNYFQIVGTITKFQLQIPSAIHSIFTSASNPVETMSHSLDCLLISLSDINIIYFRMIWSLIMPFFYLTGFFLLYGAAIQLGIAKRNLSILTTPFIYMYIFMQPTLIGGLISLLSFRQIGGMYWIQGNVSYIYNTNEHFKWLTTFVMPSLLILGFIIPLILYILLYKLKDNLNTVGSRKKMGYLYNEYRQETYYWEIIKIIQKGLIISMLTFYQDQIVIKAALIFIVVFLYQLLAKAKRPYQFHQLNNLDNSSTIVCGTSIVIAMTIYSAAKKDNQEIVWPFYILLIILNGYFCLLLIIEVIEAQIDKNIEAIDKLRDKFNRIFPKLQGKNKYFKIILENSQVRKQRIRKRFQILKKYLLSIAKLKARDIVYVPTIDSKQEKILMTNEVQSQQQIHIIPASNKVYPEFKKIVIITDYSRNRNKSSIHNTSWLVYSDPIKEHFDE